MTSRPAPSSPPTATRTWAHPRPPSTAPDIGRLAGLLGQLGHPAARPDPEQAAVVWLDGRPVRLRSTASLDRQLAQAIERRRDGRLTPGVLLEVLAEATGTEAVEVADRLGAARRVARNVARHPERTVDRTPARQLSRELPGPDRSSR
jgi:hypothetical protein